MRRICGRHFILIGQGSVVNYDMQPDFRGYLNIKEVSGKTVYGLLYLIEPEALEALDKFEGYPDVFGRKIIEVEDSQHKKFKSWVYIEPANQFGGNAVKTDYLRRVLGAAIDHNLPKEWVNKIEAYESV